MSKPHIMTPEPSGDNHHQIEQNVRQKLSEIQEIVNHTGNHPTVLVNTIKQVQEFIATMTKDLPVDELTLMTIGRELSTIEFPIWRDISIEEVLRMRGRFYTKIATLVVKLKRNNAKVDEVIGPEMARGMTEFFFSELLGRRGLQQLNKLLSPHDETDSCEYSPIDTSALASRLAKEPGVPTGFRNVLDTLSKVDLLDPKKEYKVYEQIKKLDTNLDFLREYALLKTSVEEKDPEVLKFLSDRGYKTKRGHDGRSCIKDYLVETLSMKPTVFDVMTHQLKNVQALINEFGQGVMVVLPNYAESKMTRWGLQRMKEVYRVFQAEVGDVRPIFQLLETNVLEPIRARHPPRMAPIDIDISTDLHCPTSLQLQIENAITDVSDGDDDDNSSDENGDIFMGFD